jgi:hypothetical protein
MKVRQVLVVGTLLVSTAFVFGSDEQPNNGNLRPRRRRLQREACILVQQAKDFRDGSDKTEWECELQGADRKRGEGRFVKVEGLSDSQLERSEAKSGRTSVQVENALVTEGKLLIPAGAQPEFASVQPRGPKNNHKNGKEGNSGATEEATDVGNSTNDNVFDYRRELLSGDRTVLAIRVTANDKKTSFSQKRLSNKIFGSRGDAINLSERFDTCSYGQVTMSPYSGTTFKGTTIPDTARVGVVTIDINKNVGGSKDGDIRDAVLDAAEAQLGNLERQFDHVMLCLPVRTVGRILPVCSDSRNLGSLTFFKIALYFAAWNRRLLDCLWYGRSPAGDSTSLEGLPCSNFHILLQRILITGFRFSMTIGAHTLAQQCTSLVSETHSKTTLPAHIVLTMMLSQVTTSTYIIPLRATSSMEIKLVS